MTSNTLQHKALRRRINDYYALTKPRVLRLIVFCAFIGMLLSSHQLPPLTTMIAAMVGIWMVAGAAAAFNCIIEQRIDAKMTRTSWRASARGTLAPVEVVVVSGLLGSLGLFILLRYTNELTMWLTLATFIGYAAIYTVILKPATPQNIVIGGLSGAMPPVLGWTAITGTLSYEPMLLALIIFLWTPPHFWSLALYRSDDYAKSGLPMLPVTHGSSFTRLQILLYVLVLVASTGLPYALQVSGIVYLVIAVAANIVYLGMAWQLYRAYSEPLARRLFRYSILYLALIFTALLLDHYLLLPSPI